MHPQQLTSIHVSLIFDPGLELITGNRRMDIVVSEGATFLFLLHSLCTSYPPIQHLYPPGKLGFLVNGLPLKVDSVLHEGDEIFFKDCL